MKAVSVTREIPAAAQAVFDALANPSMHPVLDGSGTVRVSNPDNPERLELGAKFGMQMRWRLPYRITNTVVEFEDGRRIAWRHFAGHRWRYELEHTNNGTRVTETFDYSRAPARRFYPLLGFPTNAERGMSATLERLEQHFAG